MDRLNSIVVGVDFSPCSATALAQAVRIAAWNQAQLHAVHVIETLVAMEMQEALIPYVKEIEEGLFAEARSAWKTFAPGIQNKDAIDFGIAINNPLVELVKRVRDRRADLLVLGSHGVSPGKTPGILATQCVRRVPTRVLLVRDGHGGPYKNVVACVDFSETSRDALAAAIRIAAQDNAALSVVHVYRAPWTRIGGAAAGPEFMRSFREALLGQLRAFFKPQRPEVVWSKARFELIESAGHGAGIIEFIRAHSCDLAVLGTRGRTNLRDVLIGSTAERVVRDAPCSILAIKPPDATPA